MEEKNIIDISEFDDLNIDNEDLPNVINEQFNAILEIDKKIQLANENCEQAKQMANKQILAKGLNGKEAINSTQDAVKSLAQAQESIQEATKVLFENQQKMADGMRYLLMLGASNIAMSRVVVTELEAKLKQATKEQLSEKARAELIDVIKLLREQESAFSKQDRMSKEIKEHNKELEKIHVIDLKQDENDKRHDLLIEETQHKNEQQDEEILRQQNVDEVHDKKIKQANILACLGIGIAVVALIIAIIGLF